MDSSTTFDNISGRAGKWIHRNFQNIMARVMVAQSHEQMTLFITESQFGQTPKCINRLVTGICNEVYRVSLVEEDVIVRLNSCDRFLMGTHDHIPKFKSLGIQVPNILAEDYSKNLIPLSYQFLSKIEGQDLGEVFETLSDEQLKSIAQEISTIFKKVQTIPSNGKFGVIWGGGASDLSNTWAERMTLWVEEMMQRGMSTGVIDDQVMRIAEELVERYEAYFSSVQPTTYYGDICSKNVMIHNGVFSGLVDLDSLAQGDPLEAIGSIVLSWYGTRGGDIYARTVMDSLGLNAMQRHLVTVYALLNQISWTCENGVQFNQNTKATVDKEKERRDKGLIKILADQLNVT